MKPTRDEILAEPAGPRLNAWIAKYVTHWQPSGMARDISGNPFPEPMPDYSGEIAAAWEVVEKIGGVAMDDNGEGLTYPRWAVFFNLPDGGTSRQVEAESAPLAICRAALLAVVG